MGIREIIVHLDATPRSALRLGVASQLAARCGAQLIGLKVIHGAVSDVNNKPQGAATTEEAFHLWLSQRGLKGDWRLARALPLKLSQYTAAAPI
jgi:hypothetical protein